MTHSKKVAIYVRVSTVEQAHHGWSIQGQTDDIREYCNKEDYKVVRIYKDEGYSAKDINRPKLQLMIEHALQGHFEAVIIWKYDRLSRNEVDFPALLHFFRKHNIDIISINELTPEEGNPYSDFIIGILGLVSSLERKVIIMRSKMGMRVRLKNGFYKGGHPPFGYFYDEKQGHLKIHETECKVVNLIFEKYLEQGTLSQVRNYLDVNGFQTKRGGKWALSTIKKILSNKIYLGYYIYSDIETYHKEVQIISEDCYQKVQKQMKKQSVYGVDNIYNREIRNYFEELSYDNDCENPVVQEYLQKKANMPLCPRCKSNVRVSKWGFHQTKNLGKLQQFFCATCKYEFTPYPKGKAKENMPYCKKCHQKLFVSKSGIYQSKNNGKIQRFYCSNCKFWFQSTPIPPKSSRPDCPKCSSNKIIGDGNQTNKNGQKLKKWKCKDCKIHFSEIIK